MIIKGNIANLSQTEQQTLGVPEPTTFIAKLDCDQALVDAQHTYQALKHGDEPMAYAPAEILETGMVSRGVLLFTARRRLNTVTNIAAQVLIHETEQHLKAQADGTAIEGF